MSPHDHKPDERATCRQQDGSARALGREPNRRLAGGSNLAVRVDHQRRGIGRMLVEHLVDRAAAEGIDVVFVAADDVDDHALSFYRSVDGRPSAVTMFDLGQMFDLGHEQQSAGPTR